MEHLKIQAVTHKSPEYWNSVALRYKILRIPLQLDYSYRELISEDKDIHLCAWDENKMIGCLILTPVSNGKVKMRQVAVDDAYQGKGIGKALVKRSEEICRENGWNEIVLHARDTAVPFYLSMNYEIFDGPFTEVGIPHRKMRKML